MAQDYKIRRDVTGEVYVGSWASNQPQRLRLTQSQPSVRKGLELLGWDASRIDSEIPKYRVYVPVTLVPDFSKASFEDLARGKKLKKAEVKSELEPAPAPAPALEPAPEIQPEPPEAEEMELASADETPGPEDIREMNREELEEVATRFDLLDSVKGTGSGGYRTVRDFKKFLIPWADEQNS